MLERIPIWLLARFTVIAADEQLLGAEFSHSTF